MAFDSSGTVVCAEFGQEVCWDAEPGEAYCYVEGRAAWGLDRLLAGTVEDADARLR